MASAIRPAVAVWARSVQKEAEELIQIGDMRVGDSSVTITFRRVAGKVVASAEQGDVRVVALL